MELLIRSQTSMAEWISNFIPQFVMDIITYPSWDQSESMWLKEAPEDMVTEHTQNAKILQR